MQTSFLRFEGVGKSFQEGKSSALVLEKVSVSFEQGKTYALTGVSGTGKSTFIHLLAGLDAPTQGKVLFNQQVLGKMSSREHEHFLQKKVGLLFQVPYLIKEFTVLENVMLASLIAQTDQDTAHKQALYLLEQVKVLDKKDSHPGALSGGQQTRVALARALINKPCFLLADEPTGNLDQKTGKEIVSLLLHLQKEWQMGMIVSTHDHYVADAMQHQYHLINGILKPLE